MTFTASVKPRTRAAIELAPSRHRSELYNSTARYARVAMVEAVLSIQERRARTWKLITAGSCVLLGAVSIAVALFW